MLVQRSEWRVRVIHHSWWACCGGNNRVIEIIADGIHAATRATERVIKEFSNPCDLQGITRVDGASTDYIISDRTHITCNGEIVWTSPTESPQADRGCCNAARWQSGGLQ